MTDVPKKVPEQMKHDTWSLYVESMSIDPAIKVQSTRGLITLLKSEMRLVGEHEYDAVLNKCLMGANEANRVYFEERNMGRASLICSAVLDDVAFLIYDPERKWAITQSGSFRYPTVPKTGDVK